MARKTTKKLDNRKPVIREQMKMYMKTYEDGSFKMLAHKADKPRNMSRRTMLNRADVRNAAITKRNKNKKY